MFDAALKESFIRRLWGRMWALVLNRLRGSFLLRPFCESRILTWLTSNLAVVSGVCTGALFAVPYQRFNNLYSLIVMLVLTGLLALGVVNGRVGAFKLPRLGGYAVVFWLLVLLGGLRPLSLRFLLFYLTAFLSLTVIGSVLTDRRALTRFCAALLAAVTLSGVYGLWQSVTGVEVVDSQVDVRLNMSMPGRLFSFFDNSNAYATVLVLTLPLFLALFFTARTRAGRRTAFLAALPPAVALVLSFSRSGWIALGVGVVIFFYFTYRWVVPLLFAAALAALPFLPATISERFFSTFAGTDSSILYRSRIRETLQPVLSGRWFSGLGLGVDAVLEELTQFYEDNTQFSILTWQIAPHAHNQYLQLWAELGIAGAASFCGMMIAFFKKCAAALFAPKSKNFFAAAGLAGLAGALVMGLADYIWFYPRVMLLFWVVAGVTMAALSAGADGEGTGKGDAGGEREPQAGALSS